jgi:Carboxypeptidase regulatory-like domain
MAKIGRSSRTLTRALWSALAGLFAVALCWPLPAVAQSTISTGSIQGTVTDPSGAAIPEATITITRKDTGQSVKLSSTATGTYNSGGLIPAVYSVKVESGGFKTTQADITVQVGVTTPANFKLELGTASTVVTVEENAVAVNTEQDTVQGVLTREQIDTLPVNGRNFLDLAQLEPGVQIQDGASFDPTKNGYSSISFGGRYGRTARIEVDGIDISDETVGTTTANIPASAIQEFQVSSSSLDLSTELTSSGAVNVTTRSGSNTWHGDGFYFGRNHALAAEQSPGTDVSFFRHQYGVDLGGPILKDKLFFFGDFERTRQDQATAVVPGVPFSGLAGNYSALFRDLELLGKVDWQIKPNWNMFFRFSDEQNRDVVPFVPNTFNPFLNVDYAHAYVVGTDFNTGPFSHSIRFGFSKFHNFITDAVSASGAFNPISGVAISIGGDPLCLGNAYDSFCSGANLLAPQGTFQQNTQIKYDGSRTIRNHIIRYGVDFDHILGGGFAAFVALQPIVFSAGAASEVVGTATGGATNPLNYAIDLITLGNGQGFFTETPGFNLPGGGQKDNRLQLYLGDTWKIRSNFNFTYGVRYVRDTGRTDSDLPPIPCSAADPTFFPVTPCTGNLLDNLVPGLGKAVNQPNSNFGGNVGFAWDPTKSGKTVIRGGIGIYYENAIFNNTLFDRPTRIPKGLFFGLAFACPGGVTFPDGSTVNTVDGLDIATQICGQAIGAPGVAPAIADLQTMFQAATKAVGASANGNYLATALTEGNGSTGNTPLSPDYVSPYSVQMNIGFQREIVPGTVFQMDYLRNVALHYILVTDPNHVGDASTLNVPSALNAIGVTNAAFGCPGMTTAAIDCAIGAGALMTDYQANGLDSGNSFAGGYPCGFLPPGPGIPLGTPACAFPGRNPSFGQMQIAYPAGRAVYNGLQMSLKSQRKNLAPGIHNANFVISYSYSRYIGQVQDTDFISNAQDFRNPNSTIGPTGLDRTNQFSAGGVFELPWWTEIGLVTHYQSALPVTLYLPGGGSIFTTDITGDGSFAGSQSGTPGTGDILPGTNVGSLNRSFGLGGLNNMITAFNNNIAGKPTPAGEALVNAGLFTPAELTSLGATVAPIAPVVPGAVRTSALFTFDTSFAWNIHLSRIWKSFPERVVVKPQITFYNLFNRQNYDSARQPANGVLTPLSSCLNMAGTFDPTAGGCSGAVNTTTKYSLKNCDNVTIACQGRTNLIGLGSGVFALGAPRQVEWGVKVSF